MAKKIALFVIDGENDFMDIPGAALPVAGAVADMERLSDWAVPNIDQFDRLYFTQDSHHYLDIAHPDWWQDASGNIVAPFTLITYADIMAGKYTPRLHYKRSVAYVKALEDNGEYSHFIWWVIVINIKMPFSLWMLNPWCGPNYHPKEQLLKLNVIMVLVLLFHSNYLCMVVG